MALIFKGKGDAMNCGVYRGVKLVEHAMKIVEKVLEKRLSYMVKVNKMQFSFMPGKGTADAVNIYFEKVTRGVLREREEVVYVFR